MIEVVCNTIQTSIIDVAHGFYCKGDHHVRNGMIDLAQRTRSRMIEVTYGDANNEITTVHADEANITPQERYLQIRITDDEHQLDIPTRKVIFVERDLEELASDERTASAQYL